MLTEIQYTIQYNNTETLSDNIVGDTYTIAHHHSIEPVFAATLESLNTFY